MGIKSLIVSTLLIIIKLLDWEENIDIVSPKFNRRSFPDGFLFGSSSAAYQYEGEANGGGRGPSIWDTFTKISGKVANGGDGQVANDFYHRYKEDIQLMKNIGLDTFRFSISWSRVLPSGKLSEGVNKEGINFYNNLIDELLKNGIEPFVTIFHWDLPQALEDQYGGFLSHKIVEDFKDFADLCFKEFGDRVKNWVTINEPYSYAYYGYEIGAFAPGRCSTWMGNCAVGNSSIEPYMVAHHLLLSHATSVRLYREKYQANQKGQIGLVTPTHWIVPYTNSNLDKKAQSRALDFMFGWFIHPIVYGDYPPIMRALVRERLPKFSPKEVFMLKGSFDFLGINYYTGNFASNVPSPISINVSYTTDSLAKLTTERYGIPIGAPTGVHGFCVYPQGIHDLLVYTKERYNNPTIYITETGMGDANNMTMIESTKDIQRVNFYETHLTAVQEAIEKGVNVKGFFAWSFLDNFEWSSGYTLRFGLNYVDYNSGLKRYPKQSALWFKKFLQK